VNGSNDIELWNSGVLGPALQVKLLIPLDEGTNFDLSLAGGYYFLVGAGVTISGTSPSNMTTSASSFGGVGGVDLEFFLDSSKNTSLDLGLAYRLLSFSDLTPTITAGNPNDASPLPNADGSKAVIDYSGIEMGVGLRFYVGKGN